jgi:hypothetical protein
VKRLIRSKKDLRYFAIDGAWTDDLARAQDFPDIRSLIRAQLEHGLRGVEVVFLMHNAPSRYDVVISPPDI